MVVSRYIHNASILYIHYIHFILSWSWLLHFSQDKVLVSVLNLIFFIALVNFCFSVLFLLFVAFVIFSYTCYSFMHCIYVRDLLDLLDLLSLWLMSVVNLLRIDFKWMFWVLICILLFSNIFTIIFSSFFINFGTLGLFISMFDKVR